MRETALSGWRPRGAWQGIVKAGRHGRASGEPGVCVSLREGVGLATLIVPEAERAALVAVCEARYGVAPPLCPAHARGGDCDFVWAGPGQWLAVSGDRPVAGRLLEELGALAAVSDQSDARALLRLSGLHVRNVLAKGCPLDLHPRAFRRGGAALTEIAHIGVHLWQVDDAPTYDLAVFRSMAGSFWSWLRASAAEFGCEVVPSAGWP